MLIKADAKALEWRVAAYLSQDKVAINEIISGVDIHAENQRKLGLPSRLIAKTYLFRFIYGGSCFSYAKDPNFKEVTKGWGNPDWWQETNDATYRKYSGLSRWHSSIFNQAITTGCLTIPSGRSYKFTPSINSRGETQWPRTKILNYPVQGLSADLMMIARVSAFKRLRELPGVLFVNTVHDDIELDVPNNEETIDKVCRTLENVFGDIPRNFERYFGIPFNVPLHGEVSVGENLYDMRIYDKG